MIQLNDDLTTSTNTQSLQCKVCQKVNMADGTQVWVCKECGAEHQPSEAMVADPAAVTPPTAPAAPPTPTV